VEKEFNLPLFKLKGIPHPGRKKNNFLMRKKKIFYLIGSTYFNKEMLFLDGKIEAYWSSNALLEKRVCGLSSVVSVPL